MKTKLAVLIGAVALAFLAAACNNPSTDASPAETGRIQLSIGVEGAEALAPAANQAPAGAARTVVPEGFSLNTFTKYEAVFTATSGGANHGPVALNAGTNAISLEVGTYTVTVTGFTGSGPYTESAEGSVTGIVVTKGNSTPANVLLGPKTGAGTGTFSWNITVPAGASGSLTITTAEGGTVADGTVNLSAGANSSTKTLAAGYYQAVISLSKTDEVAGFPEIIHIYPTLTSALTAVFTDDDFAAAVAVSDVTLTGKFAVPAAGETPAPSFSASQYNGAIAWNPAHATFMAGQSYTATVTLSAKPGYTFDGVAADAFSYSGADSVTNEENSGVVTIAFAVLPASAGTAGLSYAVDDGVIAVTAVPAGKTIQKESALNLVLTVPPEYTVTSWYIDGVAAAALGTDLTATLDPDDYAARPHRVSVFARKGGRPYSWSDTFTVEPAGGGGGGPPLNLTDFIAAAQAVTSNTPETPVTLALDPSVVLTDGTTTKTLKDTLAALSGQYIVLDLSAYTFTEFILDYMTDGFNAAIAQPAVVGVILPSTLESIPMEAFYDPGWPIDTGLRSITIPAGVTSIGEVAFYYCYNLTRVTFLGNSAAIHAQAFSGNFATVYNAASPKAGTYVTTDGSTWTKEGAEGGDGGDGGDDGGVHLAAFIAALEAVPDNTAEEPTTVTLDASVDLADLTNVKPRIVAATSALTENQHVVIDLSEQTFATTAITMFYEYFSYPTIVGIIFPDTARELYNVTGASHPSGLRSVTIPAGVTKIGTGCFLYADNLTRVTFLGNNAPYSNINNYAFANSFRAFYQAQSTKAGHYDWDGENWTWSPLE